jgi:hypothetical protein
MVEQPKVLFARTTTIVFAAIAILSIACSVLYAATLISGRMRYQMEIGGTTNEQLLLLDRKTGKMWTRVMNRATAWERVEPDAPSGE